MKTRAKTACPDPRFCSSGLHTGSALFFLQPRSSRAVSSTDTHAVPVISRTIPGCGTVESEWGREEDRCAHARGSTRLLGSVPTGRRGIHLGETRPFNPPSGTRETHE